jgi:two-component system chemotaxis response regulator CheY
MATILIADDAAFMRNSLKFLVETAGHQVLGLARDGREAVKLFDECKPDLVLMDILMPETDGLAALAQLMERNAEAKVIMVTALNGVDKRELAIQLGACGFIAKPFNQRDIIEEIERVVGSEAVSAKATGPPARPSGRTPR